MPVCTLVCCWFPIALQAKVQEHPVHHPLQQKKTIQNKDLLIESRKNGQAPALGSFL
ncbi:hypothetical protein V6Z11_D13G227000 [Gossypium hirsutum]